jgi:hypothetical protein
MKFFRKLITYRKLTTFLAIGMLLRSSIAVGYMLDTEPADGSFLSIIICEGPAGINAISGIDDHSQHHGSHHSGDDSSNNEHDHAAQEHPMSSCSFWSSSSLSILVDLSLFDLPTNYLSDEVVIYQNYTASRSPNSTSFARAPPTFS